jgi:Putative Ig domain
VKLQPVSPEYLNWKARLPFLVPRITKLVLCVCALLLAAGCNLVSLLSNPGAQVQVAVSPASVTLGPGTQQQFSATVRGTSNSAVIWRASAGSITSTGDYTAPTSTTTSQIMVTATSVADPAQSVSSAVTLEVPGKLVISTSSLNSAYSNTNYSASLSASGGTPPYTWSIAAGSLPSGIALLLSSGVLEGTTSTPGQYTFTVKVTDTALNTATQALTLAVTQQQTSGTYDGPAELPRVYLSTALADTPAPGSITTVSAGGDLQSALNNAACGDTIELQAGAVFAAGQYTFPAKACDDQHWVIVRTTTPDSSLPAEGTRMTPCYAGVASLPGRPTFSCSSPQKLLATLSYPGTGDGPVLFADGANHYRLLGLEITRSPNDGMPVTALISRAKGASITQIVLDRLYVHGSPTDETTRGVDLSGATSMAVQDSYISEFHCVVNGSCTDSQAVSGGVGDQPMGPYKIDDNFLEASGENILFGGDEATQIPADIEIRFNHLFKPMFWMPGQPGYRAPAFVVKNHFELKNAERVLFDSNLLEDVWGGFTQHGYSVLLTPKNQFNNCPSCAVTDVTIRYARMSHMGGGLVFGNSLSDSGGLPAAGERYSVHDIIADDINGQKYTGNGTFAQVGTIPKPLLAEVDINHITAFPDNVMFNVGAPDTVTIAGFTFANSISVAGQFPMTSTGAGGTENCAYYQVPVKIVSACFSDPTFSANAILASPLPASYWPAGNFFYTTANIGFVNYHNGNGGDYHLLPSSSAIGKASDGTNLGANVDAVLQAISTVE